MNKSMTRKWIATLLVAMLTVLGLGQTMVHAEEVEGPLTDVIITKVQTKDKAKDMTLDQLRNGITVEDYFTDGEVLPGVSFTWYSVTDAQLATMKAAPADYDTVAKVDAVVGVGSGTATAETGANGQVTIPNLVEGNYWVVENTKGTIKDSQAVPFGLILPFTNATGDGYLRTIHIYPKNTLKDSDPGVEKEVDESNVAIGDINTWTVTLDIPDGIEDYKQYSFYDDIDSRLDYEGIESVIAAGVNLIDGTDYDVSFVDPRLEVVFTKAGRIKLADASSDKVVVKFKTKVNDTAIMGQEIENSATLEFDNSHGTTGEKTPTDIPFVHTGGKAFRKMDGKTEGVLGGAEFMIRNAQGQLVNVAADGTVTFGGNGTIFTSDANGKFEVKGLPYGEYVLVETKAPDGYALPTNPNTDFTVSATSYYANPTEVTSGDLPADVIKTILNRKMTIPQTGGIGTALFTAIGAMMMVFSAAFYRKTKKA